MRGRHRVHIEGALVERAAVLGNQQADALEAVAFDRRLKPVRDEREVVSTRLDLAGR